jgi:hypothetical protein
VIGLHPVVGVGLPKTPSRTSISPLGHIHVDDLPDLVDRPVDLAPLTGHLDVSLVYPPAVPDTVAARAWRRRQQRRQALYPAENADLVTLDAPLGEESSPSR